MNSAVSYSMIMVPGSAISFFFFHPALGMWKFSGQGSDPSSRHNLCCSFSNAASLNPLCWLGIEPVFAGAAETPSTSLCHGGNSRACHS